MSAKELASRLREWINVEGGKWPTRSMDDDLREAADFLSRHTPESVPEWIACADRHPGNYETVLVVDGDGIRSTGFWNGTRWTIDLCENAPSEPYLTPTHWTLLPKAPGSDATVGVSK
jgi:hypothetical protein